MIQFLEERKFMYERLQLGIDLHPSDWELAEFQKLAKQIWPKYNTSVKGCQSCINALIRFVFDKQDVAVKKTTFNQPKGKSYGGESTEPEETTE